MDDLTSIRFSKKLRALISFTITVASFSAMASGCDPTEASITGCTPQPVHDCAIQPTLPCVDDRPVEYDPSTIDMLYRFYTEIDQDLATNTNIVPHSPASGIQATCVSAYATRLAYAAADISPYLISNAVFHSYFFERDLVVTYPNGQHEMWRVSNVGTGFNMPTPHELLYYFGTDTVVGSNSTGDIYLGPPVGLNDPAPTCGN